MTPEDIISKVFGIHTSEISDATSNKTIDAWDSLGHITLVSELESTYGLTLSTDDALALTSVGAIKQFLEGRDISW